MSYSLICDYKSSTEKEQQFKKPLKLITIKNMRTNVQACTFWTAQTVWTYKQYIKLHYVCFTKMFCLLFQSCPLCKFGVSIKYRNFTNFPPELSLLPFLPLLITICWPPLLIKPVILISDWSMRSGAYPRVENLTEVGSGLTQKDLTRLERLATDKQSSLLRKMCKLRP